MNNDKTKFCNVYHVVVSRLTDKEYCWLHWILILNFSKVLYVHV